MKNLPIEIAKVKTNDDIDCVVTLAREIWTQHFTAIIGTAQVNYMLNKFQSVDAIRSQISCGYEYYLTKVDHEWVGYTGLVPDLNSRKMMLSKIYVKNAYRGKGIGKVMLDFVEDKCLSEKIITLWLTVNRFNQSPVSWYKRHGFVVIDEVKKDIGDGFFMDDYIMEKSMKRIQINRVSNYEP